VFFFSPPSSRPGDFILVCTDGLHDNLDPEVLGLSPSIFKLQEKVPDHNVVLVHCFPRDGTNCA
jgi:hypothetical protein